MYYHASWRHKNLKKCSHEGCTNNRVKGGVSIMHGAMRKISSFEGCTNGAVKGGVRNYTWRREEI